MAYPTTYPNPTYPYVPYPQPVIPNTNTNIPSMNTGIIWVQGEGGAKAYPVSAGSSVVLFDSEGDRFYIKTTDQSGMPQPLRAFDYIERSESDVGVLDTSNFVTRSEFESAIAKLKKSTVTEKKGVSNGKPLVHRTDEQ